MRPSVEPFCAGVFGSVSSGLCFSKPAATCEGKRLPATSALLGTGFRANIKEGSVGVCSNNCRSLVGRGGRIMSPRNSNKPAKREAIAFWLIVLLICAIAGVLSYQAGRNWVGRRLAEVDLGSEQRAAVPGDEAGAEVASSLEQQEAPVRPVIEIEERPPTEGESREMEVRTAEERAEQSQPQNGAQLRAQEGDKDQSGEELAGIDSGEWVVISGSFSKADNAQGQADRLKTGGYTPFVTEITKDGVTFHRVNVGSFDERSDADALVRKLRDDDFVAELIHR